MDYQSPGALAQRPGTGMPRGFDANVQSIASAAHLRGVVLMKGSEVKGSVEAGELCVTLRTAHEKQRGKAGRFEHVERMANGIATGLGARGAVIVPVAVWNLIKAYAKAEVRER